MSTHDNGRGYSDDEDARDSKRRKRARSTSRSRSRSRSRDRHVDRHRSSRRRSRSRSGSPGGGGGGDTRVHVGEIDASITERDLEDAFGKFGPLGETWVATYAPFFAFIVFKNRADAEDAVKYINGTYIRNCKVRCSIALPRRSFGPGGGRPRMGYGGGSYGPPRYGGGGGGYGGRYGRREETGNYPRSKSRSPAYGRKYSPRGGASGGGRRRSRSGSRTRRRSPSYGERYSRSP